MSTLGAISFNLYRLTNSVGPYEVDFAQSLKLNGALRPFIEEGIRTVKRQH